MSGRSPLIIQLVLMQRVVEIIVRLGEFFFGKPTKVSNPFFGEMTDAGSYYECRKLFAPIGKLVEIGLEKKEHGPDGKQMSFFTWLESNYDQLIVKVTPAIEKAVSDWILDYRIKNFKEEFILEYLYIPKCDSELFDWRITFFADNELQHWCSLEMHGLEVKKILIDG